MGAGASRRKLKKVGKIVASATEAAEANPIPRDPEANPSFYLGDQLALGLVRRTLHAGSRGWLEDSSDYGRRLRDIAVLLDSVERDAETEKQSSPDSKTSYLRTRYRDRNALAAIGWIINGKTLEDVRGMAQEGPPT